MKPKHILVLKEFLEAPELLDVCSYTGYNGDVVLRLRSSSTKLLNAIHTFCDLHTIECTSKFNHNLGTMEIFVIAEDDVYKLKDS